MLRMLVGLLMVLSSVGISDINIVGLLLAIFGTFMFAWPVVDNTVNRLVAR
jgi:hypothetical protein